MPDREDDDYAPGFPPRRQVRVAASVRTNPEEHYGYESPKRRSVTYEAVFIPLLVAVLLFSLMAVLMLKMNIEDRQTTQAAAQTASQRSPDGSMIKTPAPQPATPRPAADMNTWMPAILALFGSLIVVVLTSWINTKALSGQIDALRAEVKQGFAELRLEFHTKMDSLDRRVVRLEGERLIK